MDITDNAGLVGPGSEVDQVEFLMSKILYIAELCRAADDPLTNLQKRPYPDLCAVGL